MPKKGKKGGKKGKGKKASDEGPQVQGAPSCSVPVSATVARSRVHDGHATARTRTRPACARRGQSTGEHASQADSQRVAVRTTLCRDPDRRGERRQSRGHTHGAHV